MTDAEIMLSIVLLLLVLVLAINVLTLHDRIQKIEANILTKKRGMESREAKIKKVIFNDPATIIFWSDGTKTVVKCSEGDEFDKEKGILYASLKKFCNGIEYNNILKNIGSFGDWNDFLSGITYKE